MTNQEKEICIHAVVRGLVQGVCYRASTEKKAKELDLRGTVRNCPDGSVEIYAAGTEENIAKLLEWCHEGPPYADVTEVKSKRIEALPFPSLPYFTIQY